MKLKLISLIGDAVNESHINLIHESGFQLCSCNSLNGLTQAISYGLGYDCILLSWNTDLIDTLKNIRRLGIHTPVLVLTKSIDTNKTVQALDNGADDIVLLPIDSIELIARIKALHRRHTKTRYHNITIGSIEYDCESFSAFQNGKLLNFSAQESHVFGILVERSCRPVAKHELQKIMNGYGYKVSFNALEVAIHRLRNKLKLVDLQIETIRGFGYRLDNPSRKVHY